MKKYVIIFAVALACFGFAPQTHAAISLVQSTSTQADLNDTRTVKFITNPTINNLIVGVDAWGTGAGDVTCSDSAGNTYTTTTPSHDVAHGESLEICYAIVTQTVTSDTVTFAGPTGGGSLTAIHEFRGNVTSSVLDTATQRTNAGCTGTDCVSSGYTTPNMAGDLVFGAVVDTSGGAGTITKGTAFTQMQNPTFLMTEYAIQNTAAAAATTFSFQNASVAYDANMAMFKAAGNTTGYAWGEKTGWINFGVPTGGVQVLTTTVIGYGWSQNFGWINLAPPGVAPISVLQHKAFQASGSAGSTTIVSFDNPVTAGSLIWVGVNSYVDVTTVTSIHDNVNAGNYTYAASSTQPSVPNNTFNKNFIYFYPNSSAGSPTITVTLNNPDGTYASFISLMEIAGLDPVSPLDAIADGHDTSGNSVTHVSSSFYTTSYPNEIMTAYAAEQHTPVIWSAEPGWTLADTTSTSGIGAQGDQYNITSSTVTTSTYMDTDGGVTSLNIVAATFKASAGATLATDGDFVAQTGGAGACNGASAAWGHGEICVKVPTAAATGSAPIYVTSNGNTSNNFAFTITEVSASPPSAPGTPTYTSIASSTLTVNWTSGAGSTYYKIERATSTQSYLQIATTSALNYGDSGLSANTTYYYRERGTNSGGDSSYSASSSVLTLPDIPGTPTYASVGSSTLTVNWTAPTGGATSYIIQRATSSQSYAQITTTTLLTINQSGLATSTSYYYRVIGVNATGNGQTSASSSVTTSNGNVSPNAPSEDSPANATEDFPTTGIFKMTATDPNGDNLQYKVTIYSDSSCTSVVQTDDQSSSQTGWSGQNASSSQEYTSATQAVFTVQSALSQNTTYYWMASVKDPEGSGSWVDSSCSGSTSFSTTFGNWTADSGLGNWSISGNQLVVVPSSGSSIQLHAAGQSQTNGVIEFKVKSSAAGANTGNAGGIARADSGANRYHASTADFLNQRETIGKTISSAYTVIATSSFTFSGSTFYSLRGSLSGTTLKSWLNGSSSLTVTDSALSSAGFLGLAASSTNGSATFTFDDFAWYTSTVITMNSLPVGGSWAVRDSGATAIACATGSTWDVGTYSGQVPIDYDNGGGTVAVWTNNTCSGAPDQIYPSSGLATNIFGGDTYAYTAGTAGGGGAPEGSVFVTSTIVISGAGAVSY